MNRFKQWWMAYKLLKKYDLGFYGLRSIGHGSYMTPHDTTKRPWIEANPFDPKFIEVFMHELGHHIYDKVGLSGDGLGDISWYYKNLLWYANETDTPMNMVIHEEAYATIIGIRIAKVVGITLDKAWLSQKFHTYTGSAYSYMSKNCVDREYLTEVVSILSLKIHKT